MCLKLYLTAVWQYLNLVSFSTIQYIDKNNFPSFLL